MTRAEDQEFKHYHRNLKRLISLEREEEISAQLLEIDTLSGNERQQKGRAILNLHGKDAGMGLGGSYLVRLSLKSNLPQSEISVGDVVVVSKHKPKGDEAQAIVVERSRKSFLIAYQKHPPRIAYGTKVRLDLYANDVTFQRMFKALNDLSEFPQLLDLLTGRLMPSVQEATKILSQSKLNEAQIMAVEESLTTEDIFLIHGPPGTGKTTTMVELVMQHVQKGAKVLCCADSNVAVDNLLERFSDAKAKVVRLGNPVRMDSSLVQCSLTYLLEDEEFYQLSNANWGKVAEFKEEQLQFIPANGKNRRGLRDDEILRIARSGVSKRGIPLDHIRKMAQWINLQRGINKLVEQARELERKAIEHVLEEVDIVCCTNVTAGSEVLDGFRFSLVVIDEATQATEPSCIIPMLKGRKWVLAGDHKQLPPTVLCAEARALEKTLFERLIDTLPSNKHRLLTIQYRMNKVLMQFSNSNFYDNRLVAHKSVEKRSLNTYPGFQVPSYYNPEYRHVVDADRPIVLLNSDEQEYRPKGSFSFGNKGEVQKVRQVVELMLDCRIFPQDIGVICPYAHQVQLINESLQASGVECKSIDGFQGREKEIIILSMVRNNDKGEFGFLKDKRRLNVALTRSRSKTVIIGNVQFLSQDDHYNYLIDSFM